MDTPTTETHDALSDRIIQLAAAQVELPPEQVTPDSRFADDLGFDSLDLVEFTMEIEEEFDLTVPGEVADGIATVRDAIDQARRILESQSGTE